MKKSQEEILVSEMVEALRKIVGWRENDYPEGVSRATFAIEYMEETASEMLRKIDA